MRALPVVPFPCRLEPVMPGLVPGIHVFAGNLKESRGCPACAGHDVGCKGNEQ